MSLRREVLDFLRDGGIAHCVIGATALASWKYVRHTADFDILTMNGRVLARSFWPPSILEHVDYLRRGESDDPLAGVVRFKQSPDALDVIVGRDQIMAYAVATAVDDELLGARVATPIALALMKLEAGGVHDIQDVARLAEFRALEGEDLLALVEERSSELSDWGKRAWAKLKRLTAPQDG